MSTYWLTAVADTRREKVGSKVVGKVHLPAGQIGPGQAVVITRCGETLQNAVHSLIDSDKVTCPACRNDEFRQRRTRKPGWWARR